MLAAVDLLNRYCNSRRCREAAAELVSSLAPLCLPGPSVVWNEMINGQKLWPALGHRRAHTRIVHIEMSFFLQLCFSRRLNYLGLRNETRKVTKTVVVMT